MKPKKQSELSETNKAIRGYLSYSVELEAIMAPQAI